MGVSPDQLGSKGTFSKLWDTSEASLSFILCAKDPGGRLQINLRLCVFCVSGFNFACIFVKIFST
jgi:hypothetical protein